MPKFKKTKYIFILSFCFFTFFLFFTPFAIAQTNIADVYDIADKNAKNGDIVTFIPNQGINSSTVPYDQHLFGVLQSSPIAVYRRVDGTGQPIVKAGVASVNVTTLNGDIKAGDFITSSEISGAGQKADISGYTIGIAIKDFNSQSGTPLVYKGKSLRSGQIDVAVDIKFAELSNTPSFKQLFSGLGSALLQSTQAPDAFAKTFKYAIVGLIMILTIIFDFIVLSRTIPKAIEALGRNPLSRSVIMFSLGLNLALVALTLVVGLAISFIIIRL